MTSLQQAVNELYADSFVNAHGVRVSDDDLPSFSQAHDSFDALDDAKEQLSDLAMMADAPKPSDPHKISDPAKAIIFLLAGNAYFTVRSMKTGQRYTFRVSMPKPDENRFPQTWKQNWKANQAPVHFVSYLSGTSNESDYTYLGMIKNGQFMSTRKSAHLASSTVFKAFSFVFSHLVRVQMPPQAEIWHEGRCGRCGRKLTVPESIEAGIGPECATRMQ